MPLVAFSLKGNPVYTVFEVRPYAVMLSFEVTGYILTPIVTWYSLYIYTDPGQAEGARLDCAGVSPYHHSVLRFLSSFSTWSIAMLGNWPPTG